MHTFLCICFMILARKWQKFINSWESINLIFTNAQIFDTKSQSLKKHLDTACYIFIVLFAMFFGLIQLQMYFELTKVCDDEKYTKVELMLRSTFPEFFFIFGYNHLSGIILMLLVLNMLFTRTFNDFFIIIMSKLLSRKFDIFNEKLLLNISVSF